MTQQLKDLFKSFTSQTIEEQFASIAKVRDTRSIERPAVAIKRRKKESATSDRLKDKAKQLLMNLSEDEREAMIAKLKEQMQ